MRPLVSIEQQSPRRPCDSNVFTPVCQSFRSQGGGCYDVTSCYGHPPEQHPLDSTTPQTAPPWTAPPTPWAVPPPDSTTLLDSTTPWIAPALWTAPPPGQHHPWTAPVRQQPPSPRTAPAPWIAPPLDTPSLSSCQQAGATHPTRMLSCIFSNSSKFILCTMNVDDTCKAQYQADK